MALWAYAVESCSLHFRGREFSLISSSPSCRSAPFLVSSVHQKEASCFPNQPSWHCRPRCIEYAAGDSKPIAIGPMLPMATSCSKRGVVGPLESRGSGSCCKIFCVTSFSCRWFFGGDFCWESVVTWMTTWHSWWFHGKKHRGVVFLAMVLARSSPALAGIVANLPMVLGSPDFLTGFWMILVCPRVVGCPKVRYGHYHPMDGTRGGRSKKAGHHEPSRLYSCYAALWHVNCLG